MLDVTGNNIANANTAGFKASNVVFQDTLSQMLTGGAAPVNGQGGTNPIQVGLGVQVGGVSTNFGQGSAQVHRQGHRPDDLRRRVLRGRPRQREPLHPRRRPSTSTRPATWSPRTATSCRATRATAPAASTPPAAQRHQVPGIANPDPVNPLKSYNIGPTASSPASSPTATKTPLSRSRWRTSPTRPAWTRSATPPSGPAPTPAPPRSACPAAAAAAPSSGGAARCRNVDLAQEFTNLIIAQRGFQANSRVITTSDEVLQDLVNIKR